MSSSKNILLFLRANYSQGEIIIIIIIIIPEGVINVNGTTGMWDVPVITDRTVPANRPDTVGLLHDKKE
jgi:hypothetical protein